MKTAIMLIAHGAPESAGRDSAVNNSACLEKELGLRTYVGYLHLEPSIADTARRMLDDGMERIIAVPLFVFPGLLPDVMVRKAFGFEPRSSGGIFRCGEKEGEVVFTGTFADHPMMEGILRDVCSRYGATPDRTSVMLIYHGSRSGSGKEYVDRCQGYLASKGFDVVSAYNEFQSPTVEEAAEALRTKGRDILAIPMFVSPGSHTRSDIPPKLGLDGSDECDIGDGHMLRYVPEIGMHHDIIGILKSRISEVWVSKVSS